jgi:hypothetical protein
MLRLRAEFPSKFQRIGQLSSVDNAEVLQAFSMRFPLSLPN